MMKDDGGRLLEVLLKVSEKAANVARACRQKDALFKLLVQEKLGDEKNPRFIQDFKTLADVLIQETIRHDIGIEISFVFVLLGIVQSFSLAAKNVILRNADALLPFFEISESLYDLYFGNNVNRVELWMRDSMLLVVDPSDNWSSRVASQERPPARILFRERQFPELAKMVRGEETNVFSNTLGKTVVVEVCSTSAETTQLLAEVLDDDAEIAQLLASEVHKEISLGDVPVETDVSNCDLDIDISDLGIWIDPIDSTADYISGEEVVDEATGLHLGGLQCVTVLIGAYVKSTGLPVLGVVNQPFHTYQNSLWKGQCYWGYVGGDGGRSSSNSRCSFTVPEAPNRVLLLGRNEEPTVKAKLLESGFEAMEAPGAGYKILSVAVGRASAYVLSKSTTFRWDTCGPQALLLALGGGILDYAKFTNQTKPEDSQLQYSGDDTTFANRGGLIAYRDIETLQSLRQALLK